MAGREKKKERGRLPPLIGCCYDVQGESWATPGEGVRGYSVAHVSLLDSHYRQRMSQGRHRNMKKVCPAQTVLKLAILEGN